MNIRGSPPRFDTDVSDNSSDSLFAPPGPTISVLPCEHIQRHRDERGRVPGLLLAGPSAFSEVLYSICLASRPGSELLFQAVSVRARVTQKAPQAYRGDAHGLCTKRQGPRE